MNREDEVTVVHVDGRLSVLGVRNLDCTITGAAGPVIVDLSNLLSADDAGVAALRLLSEQGVQLRGVSPYMTLLLREDRPREMKR